MYDGDISATSHGDPYIWAEEAMRLSTHVLYIVGPTEERNLYNNIYEKPIGAHKVILNEDIFFLYLDVLLFMFFHEAKKRFLLILFG